MRETDTASHALKLEDVRAATIRWLAGRRERMFVNISKLEKILKAEYRAFGVSFGKTEKGMYLMNGTGWIIEVDEECVTKEFLGTVIKAIGAQTYRIRYVFSVKE